ncbi:beta-galactosidase-like [Uloborus diversus]|uniref:beta-galactosidase-like n=1 Tax=Uloborus diversus TaxID=327109 RepID=UPI00240996E4|nr:beta-galactosidase-like [Uloborus diversus]
MAQNIFASVIVLTCISMVLSRKFTVDYENNCFLKDGKPFRYVSGSIHYFRVPPEFWHDRIYKMKMAGLNAIQTYVEWSGHEPEPGTYNFDGYYDLPKFLKTAHDLDMLVILRAGPFIDAERDMGGLPYWLLRIDPNMKFRSYDASYIKYVDNWYSILLQRIEPYLYNNGGPIITVQIENEYGSTGICDAQYKSHLRDFFNVHLKGQVVLFTTDGSSQSALMCGKTDQVLSTVDFGSGANVSEIFNYVRWQQASGPLVNSEFYPGWLDHWGAPHAEVDSKGIVKTLTEILMHNASVNVYMFHGGTSFGFGAGSNLGDTFQACPTSYDYDAPLSEAGDPTPKYFAMREAIGKFLPLPPGPLPEPAPKMSIPPIALKKVASIWDYASVNNNPVVSPFPLSFENLSHPYGFVLYSSTVDFIPSDPAVLTVKGIADRAYVYVKKVLQGILSREHKIETIPIKVLQGETIDILVENEGRVCFGNGINDRKGIFQNVTLGSKNLRKWTMTPIPLDEASLREINSNILLNKKEYSLHAPAFYSGEFVLQNKTSYDTFLHLQGWHKGVAFLNNFNLGRYWPIVGPQVTLYAPSVLFKPPPEKNKIVLLELEHAPCSNQKYCTVEFVQNPTVNGTTPTS